MSREHPNLPDWVTARISDPAVADWAECLLLDLCRIDTALGPDLDRLAGGEAACCTLLAEAMAPWLPETARVSRLAVAPTVRDDPAYTPPYYAGDARDDPAGVYQGRWNMLIDPAGGPGLPRGSWLLNAHVDTVPPHIPPTRPIPGRVAGRGSADNKNGMVAIALVARLLAEAHREGLSGGADPVCYMVSIDEEMGGNGTLGALPALTGLDGARVVVLEPTSLRPFPANRGAVWFDMTLRSDDPDRRRWMWGAVAEVVLAVAGTGRALRATSRSSLFGPKDVPTCFGVCGPFGSHPASACGQVALTWPGQGSRATAAREAVLAHLDAAVASGDLEHTAADPDIMAGEDFTVLVHARDGHMGSYERDSDAVVKAASIARALGRTGLGLPEWPDDAAVVHVEGGQGFLPDRSVADVTDALEEAFSRALAAVPGRIGVADGALSGSISFDKLHNAAFASSPDADGAPRLAAAMAMLTGGQAPPLRGWKASCDARLFARVCPDVTTFGPGALEVAHSVHEAIDVADICAAAGAVTLAILSSTRGTG